MAANDVDTERVDRFRPDRADDLVGVFGHGVQRAAEPVVVEGVGVNAVDLVHRPGVGPVSHRDHRCRVRQPVGDQRLDHLAMAAMIEHASRRIGILGATAHPTAAWATQVTRNMVANLEDAGCHMKYLIRDRGRKYPAMSPPPRGPRPSPPDPLAVDQWSAC